MHHRLVQHTWPAGNQLVELREQARAVGDAQPVTVERYEGILVEIKLTATV